MSKDADESSEAFEQFVRERGTALMRGARALTGDWHSGADLAQETLVRLYTAWPRLMNEKAAWSYAQKTMIRLHSKQQRRKWKKEIPTTALPEKIELRNDSKDYELLDMLKGLSLRQRQVLVLRFVFDLSVDSTANIMECTPGTVKSTTFDGLKKLRTLITETV